ncbi:MAG TPA: nucleotidyl transferase AbiEii/AbiGii toxin family protein [Terriglobales bacterium]|nr:nucleotidyl transferase AbiEii/AbiGii toxin family protein [Terriglobales bacterium]
MIPEPQRTYILELFKALGPVADGFVVAGAQAMKFMLSQARATKDIDFVLDVVALRGEKHSIAQTLQKLEYALPAHREVRQYAIILASTNGACR